MSSDAPEIRIKDYGLYMRNVRLRLPFRYGKAVLVAAPILHLRLVVESGTGDTAVGVAADMLPPKWFDKDPAKTFRDNIDDLLAAVTIAAQHYTAIGRSLVSPFDLWKTALDEIKFAGASAGLNGLTAQFGSSLFERAVIDATGKLAGQCFASMLRENTLGIDAGAVFEELEGRRQKDYLPARPSPSIAVRHTIGIGDPLWDAETVGSNAGSLGLPLTVESWVREAGIHIFKIKVSGEADSDGARLEDIVKLLDETADAKYRVTLDGNEQFASADALAAWWGALAERRRLRAFWPRVMFFEQPVERDQALRAAIEPAARAEPAFPPLIIDESDESVECFRRAADLGYSGTSAKNCKGVFKSVLNSMLIGWFNDNSGRQFFMSAEDLCNQPLVPLQQDLCVIAALGIEHAERNGHHYGGTLAHLSEAELNDAIEKHDTLYEPFSDTARLRIRDGALDVRSMQCPGLGVAATTDFDSMTPLNEWNNDSLGLDDTVTQESRP